MRELSVSKNEGKESFWTLGGTSRQLFLQVEKL